MATKVFRSRLYHPWFLCMWASRRRKKLQKHVKSYDAAIALGCDSATETVKDLVSTDVKVIEGMKTTGIMNGRQSFRLPGSLFLEGCRVIPVSQENGA